MLEGHTPNSALCKLSLSKQKTEERQDQVTGPAMLSCGLRELKSKEGLSSWLGSSYTCRLDEPWESPESSEFLDRVQGWRGPGISHSLCPSLHHPEQALLGQALPLCVSYSLSCCLFLDIHVKF